MKKTFCSIQLPCKPYIRKYASTIYGNPVRADRSSSLGIIIQLSLDKKLYENRHFGESFIYQGLDDQLTVEVNKWQFERIGFDFSAESIININKFLEEDFEQDLYKFCSLFRRYNPKADGRDHGTKDAILLFCKLHGIEIEYDIGYDGLRKKELRYRRKMTKHLPEDPTLQKVA